MKKIAYLHNLPLEYYPPATNFLGLLGSQSNVEVQVFTTANRKGRAAYTNPQIRIARSRSPDKDAHEGLRFLQAIGWHLKTALALRRFQPDAVLYVEPHSAIAAWLYFTLLRGRGRLFVHHHEYYAADDYRRPGMRLPRLGRRLEQGFLFGRAEWISQTNEDRLRLARGDHPDVLAGTWQVLPNYPPAAWAPPARSRAGRTEPRLRMIYVGSASFEDTYIEEIVRWTAAHPDAASLHVCGYNVAHEVWQWLERERFDNVSCGRDGIDYADLPKLLQDFDVGLVLYRGNTSNFVYNVPNKVFEYLRCGLTVWYPREMKGITNFRNGQNLPIEEIDFGALGGRRPAEFRSPAMERIVPAHFTAESAFASLMERLIPAGVSA